MGGACGAKWWAVALLALKEWLAEGGIREIVLVGCSQCCRQKCDKAASIALARQPRQTRMLWVMTCRHGHHCPGPWLLTDCF